jgi:hypothetical protein
MNDNVVISSCGIIATLLTLDVVAGEPQLPSILAQSPVAPIDELPANQRVTPLFPIRLSVAGALLSPTQLTLCP